MTTMKQIAELAGVSRGTVDRVLNNRGSVNKETKARILDIVSELGYSTNADGRALSIQKKQFTIAYVYASDDYNPFFDDIVYGIQQKALSFSQYNITLVLRKVCVDNSDIFYETVLDLLTNYDISGFIFSPFSQEEYKKAFELAASHHKPVVACNTDITNDQQIAYVGNDYYSCGVLAAGILAKITGGRSNNAIVARHSDPQEINQPLRRIVGFEDALKTNYPDIKIVDFLNSNDDNYECYHIVKKLFEEHPEIDSIFLSSIAVEGFTKALCDLHLENKIKVVTVDEFKQTREAVKAGIIDVTVCQNPRWQGEKSMELILKYLINKQLPDKKFYYSQMDIKIRESFLIEDFSGYNSAENN